MLDTVKELLMCLLSISAFFVRHTAENMVSNNVFYYSEFKR